MVTVSLNEAAHWREKATKPCLKNGTYSIEEKKEWAFLPMLSIGSPARRWMKIVVTALGTTGDVFPLLALTNQLVIAGHHVRFCAADIYRDVASNVNADFQAINSAFDLIEFRKRMDRIVSMYNPITIATRILKETILRYGKERYQDCLPLMKGYDLAICDSTDIPGQEAAIRNSVPWITVTYCPGFIKASDNTVYPFSNWNPVLRPILWKMVEWITSRTTDPLFNQFITSIGGKSRTSVTLEGRFSPHLNFIAASPTLCPSANFPANHKFTGAWYFAEPNYIPPPELVDFLQSGPRPIVISFGSVSDSNGHETTEILIDAVKMIGQRAIIQAGWGQLGGQGDLTDILSIGYVPHHWLFPRASCIVHHGGAGTATSACRAGVPSIVVPHHPEQSYWGNRLFDLGVAPKSLHRRNLTMKQLAKRMNQVLENPIMTERAQKLGTQMKSENGLITATHLVQSLGGFTHNSVM